VGSASSTAPPSTSTKQKPLSNNELDYYTDGSNVVGKNVKP
jgi:hypothetical protein